MNHETRKWEEDIWTRLPKVIWNRPRCAANTPLVYSRAPHIATKITPSRGPIPKPNCLIPRPIRPTIQNRNHIPSAVLPQCAEQTDRHRDQQMVGGNVRWLFDDCSMLFCKILHHPNHLLAHLLPKESHTPYHLRPRRHNRQFTPKINKLYDSNFVQRMLYKDLYWLTIFYMYVLYSIFLYCVSRVELRFVNSK